MAVGLLLGIVLAVVVGLLLLNGLFLLLGCYLAGLTKVTYTQALWAVAATFVALAAVNGAAVSLIEVPSLIAASILGLSLVLFPLLAVRMLGGASLGRSLLAWLTWEAQATAAAALFTSIAWLTLAEGFIIPTGAMADTLRGYHKMVVCPQCQLAFPVNASVEAEPTSGTAAKVSGCTCPNCRFHITNLDQNGPTVRWGDRILVSKCLLSQVLVPRRFDLVVFDFPGEAASAVRPPIAPAPVRYVKRVIGLPGENLGIYYGKIYVLKGVPPHPEDSQVPAGDLHLTSYMHEDECKELLERGGAGQASQRFQILRKGPNEIMDLRRLVYDNDHPAGDLSMLPRWSAESGGGWSEATGHGFRHETGQGDSVGWLRYHHILRQPRDTLDPPRLQLITDFAGYNTYEIDGAFGFPPKQNWVGDLILECEVNVEQPGGELILELSRGVERFRVGWNLVTGVSSLHRVLADRVELLETRASPLGQKGTYRLRFANVDDRLTVWINDGLLFGEGVAYEASGQRGPTAANDWQPASIGARGAAVKVARLKLWRDTYWTLHPGTADADLAPEDWSEPSRWQPLRELPARTMYVQPGHYFGLGDNSPESSDSRSWGLVPAGNVVGRALLLYYPFSRWRAL